MSGRLPPLLASWLLPALLSAGHLPAPLAADEVVRRVGRVTIRVDLARAFPGGVVVVRLGGARLGSAWALLDGRRAPFYPDRGSPRALVPVAATTEAGPATLGIEIAARRGVQRLVVPVQIAGRAFPAGDLALDEARRALLARGDVLHDAERLLASIRVESRSPAPGRLLPPVTGRGLGFGELRSPPAVSDLESRIDGLGGERHRGLDYAVPVGTSVRAPGDGTVLFAGPLVLSGNTVVIDHGQGVISVLQHLSRIFARDGEAVAPGAEIGASGDSGLVSQPVLEWRVYLHGVAVDPTVLASILG
jgi:hypothetical protein